MHITVITEDEEIALILERALAIRGYFVFMAEGQDGFIEHINAKKKCELLILDLRHNDYKDFLKYMQSDHKLIPVMVLSDDDSPKSIDDAIDLSVKEYIITPFDLSLISERIQALLQIGNTNDE